MRPRPLLLALPGLVLPASANGGDEIVIVSEAPREYASFGNSIDLDGGRLLVGSQEEGSIRGAALLYDATTGAPITTLHPADIEAYHLGRRVALEGDLALVSASQTNNGSAYLFDWTTGQQTAELRPPEINWQEYYGDSVDLAGGIAVVGNPEGEEWGQFIGSVYVFDAATGQKTFTLVPGDPGPHRALGHSVATDGRWIVAGAPERDGKRGAAYVFSAATGAQVYRLVESDGESFDYFGRSVAVQGDVALVGSRGEVHVFDLTTGTETMRLVPKGASQYYPGLIVVDGTTVLVGDPSSEEHGVPSAGAAYVFDLATGALRGKLQASEPESSDFGAGLGVEGTTIAVGAPGQLVDGKDGAGAVFLRTSRTQALGTNFCGPAVPNSTGSPGVIAAYGSYRVSDGCVTLGATDLPPTVLAYFLNAPLQGYVQNPGGSQGHLCLDGGVGRYSKLAESTGHGSLWLALDPALTPRPGGPVAIQPGETWNFQCWHRDENPGSTSNFTDAVAITFQ